METSATIQSLQPSCEDYYSSGNEGSFDVRTKSNIVANKVGPKEFKAPVGTDLRSDSGYSSFTAGTMSSADSAPSIKGPPVSVPKDLSNDDPEFRDRLYLSRQQEQNAQRPRKATRRRPTLQHVYESQPRASSRRRTTGSEYEVKVECSDPNCTTCDPKSQPRRKRRPSVGSRDSGTVISTRSGRSSSISRPAMHTAQTPVPLWNPGEPPTVYMNSPNSPNYHRQMHYARPQQPFPQYHFYGHPGSIMPPPPLPSNYQATYGHPPGYPTPNPSPQNYQTQRLSPVQASYPESRGSERRRRSPPVRLIAAQTRRRELPKIPLLIQSKDSIHHTHSESEESESESDWSVTGDVGEDEEDEKKAEEQEVTTVDRGRGPVVQRPPVGTVVSISGHRRRSRSRISASSSKLKLSENEKKAIAEKILDRGRKNVAFAQHPVRHRHQARTPPKVREEVAHAMFESLDSATKQKPAVLREDSYNRSSGPIERETGSVDELLKLEYKIRELDDESKRDTDQALNLQEAERTQNRIQNSSKGSSNVVLELRTRTEPQQDPGFEEDTRLLVSNENHLDDERKTDSCQYESFKATPAPASESALISLPLPHQVSIVPGEEHSQQELSFSHAASLRSNGVSPNEEQESPDCSVESDAQSSEASEQYEVHVDDAVNSAMNVVKNLLLRELFDHALPNATDASDGTTGSSSASTGSSSSGSFALSSLPPHIPSKAKRTRENGRNPGDGDGDGDNSDDEDDRPKKKGGRGSPDRFPQRRLKCPFYQRNPKKYTKAACKGSGFVDMAKLKDHIKRVHTQPLRCSRCWLEMESDEAYSEHLQQESICKKAIEPSDDRIRPQLLKRLDFKKAPYSNARNIDEKWKMLFRVLFPSDSSIPSPYEQQGMSPQLERALYEALEEELTRELALVIEPIMTRIKGCIPAIIERCREKLQSSAASSDDEVVLTPSSSLSVTSNGKSGCGSTTRQDSPQSSSATSSSPVGAFDKSPDTRQMKLGEEAIPAHSAGISADLGRNTISPDIFVAGHGPGYMIQDFDQHGPSQHSQHGGDIYNFNDILVPRLHLDYPVVPDTRPRTADLMRESEPTLFSNTQDTTCGPYQKSSGGQALQQSFSTIAFPSPNWSENNMSWYDPDAMQSDPGRKDPECGSTLPLEDWEYFVKDFDVNGSRHC